ENSGVIRKKAKANFKTLGSKLGTAMKEAAVQIATFSQSEISALEQDGKLNLEIGANSYTIELQDVEITADDIPGWSVASKG
ncbi:DUF5915 domain-containing protein, partial [Acinetobacter baumannii]